MENAMTQEQLAEAIREEKLPRICMKHPAPVYFDEPKCPACVLLWENDRREIGCALTIRKRSV